MNAAEFMSPEAEELLKEVAADPRSKIRMQGRRAIGRKRWRGPRSCYTKPDLSQAEMIKIAQSLALVFEVSDLAVASPATVSRCGMVYLEPVHLGWKPLVDTWCVGLRESLPTQATNIQALLHENVGATLAFLRKSCRERIPSADANLVMSCLDLLDALLLPERGVSAEIHGEDGLERVILMYFFFAFVWSFGANIDDDSREPFSNFLREQFASSVVPVPPKEGLVYDYCVSNEQPMFERWANRVEKFKYDPAQPYFNILATNGRNHVLHLSARGLECHW